MRIDIYTDGAASGNPGPGGYGLLMEAGSYRKEFSEGFRRTTNNRMELLAIVRALEMLRQVGHEIHVYSDSKYVVDAVLKGWLWNWQKKGFANRKNADLWRRFIPLYQKHQPKLHWIRGHNDHPQNEYCDQLAVKARKKSALPPDRGYEALDQKET